MYYSYKRAYERNRSNFEKSKETNGYKGWRRAQYNAQHGHCAWCYKFVEYKDMDADHISPVGKAGFSYDVNDFDNLVLACHECNRDIKKDTSYNEVAYENALRKMTTEQKQEGFAPKKEYWSRPEWIGANKYCKSYSDFEPTDVPEPDRNVWERESPLIKDYSLKISEAKYYKEKVSNVYNKNKRTVWRVIKWVLLGLVIILLVNAFSSSSSKNQSTTTYKKYCDYACQEAGRAKYEAEEARKIQKMKEEEAEEARRYWNCRNAGGSDYDCG